MTRGIKSEHQERADFKIDILIEKQAESGERENEDAWVLKENRKVLVAAVLDGATVLSSITGIKEEKEKTGVFASRFGAVGIEKNYDTAFSAEDLVLAANRKIADALVSQKIDPEKTSNFELSESQVAVVRIDKKKRTLEICQLGDTAVIIKRKNRQVEVVIHPSVVPQDREGLSLAKEKSQQRSITLRKALSDPTVVKKMREGRGLSNLPDGKGIGVLNGQSSAKLYIKARQFPLDEIDRVVLLSDGLFLPKNLDEIEPDWNKMMDIINREGLKGLYQRILEEYKNDSTFEKYPRYKQYDDATGIAIDFNK